MLSLSLSRPLWLSLSYIISDMTMNMKKADTSYNDHVKLIFSSDWNNDALDCGYEYNYK